MTTFSSIVNYLVDNILAPIVPLLAGAALFLFLFGLAIFILNSENSEKAQSGRTYMFWGIIALFVMTSVWGLVRFLGDSFEDVIPNTDRIQDVDILKRDIFP